VKRRSISRRRGEGPFGSREGGLPAGKGKAILTGHHNDIRGKEGQKSKKTSPRKEFRSKLGVQKGRIYRRIERKQGVNK